MATSPVMRKLLNLMEDESSRPYALCCLTWFISKGDLQILINVQASGLMSKILKMLNCTNNDVKFPSLILLQLIAYKSSQDMISDLFRKNTNVMSAIVIRVKQLLNDQDIEFQ